MKVTFRILLVILALVAVLWVACTSETTVPPSETPVPPSETPVPTETPVPPSEDVEAYRDAVQKDVGVMIAGMEGIGLLFEQMSQRPALLFDENWAVDMAVEIYVLREGYEGLESIQPPAHLVEYHADIVNAFQPCYEATYFYAEGLDYIDADLIVKGTDKITECTIRIVALEPLDEVIAR